MTDVLFKPVMEYRHFSVEKISGVSYRDETTGDFFEIISQRIRFEE